MVTVCYVSVASTYLAKHKEIPAISLCFEFFCQRVELWYECFIESESRNMSRSIDTETVYTHLNKLSVAINKILAHCRIFGVQIHTVACNLGIPSRVIVPIPFVTDMVIVVVRIVVLSVFVFKGIYTRIVSFRVGQIIVVGKNGIWV